MRMSSFEISLGSRMRLWANKGSGPAQCGALRHCQRVTACDRQTLLRAIQRLNLVLFIITQHQSAIRWIEVQPYHVGQLLHEAWILADLECPRQVRLRAVGPHTRKTIDRLTPKCRPRRGVRRPLLRGHFHNPWHHLLTPPHTLEKTHKSKGSSYLCDRSVSERAYTNDLGPQTF